MERPDGTDQGTGHSRGSDPSTGGSDGSSGTAGTLLPLIPAARKGALPAAGRRPRPLCPTGSAHHSCPKRHLPTPHPKRAPKQDFWIVGGELQCLGRNSWPWASEQASRTQNQDCPWPAESNLQVPTPNPWIPQQDTRTCEWNSGCGLTSDRGSPRHSARSFEQRLPATQPPKWISSSSSSPC